MAVEVTLMWPLVEASASAYEAYKTCHFVGLEKSQCYSLRFLRKAPTKNAIKSWISVSKCNESPLSQCQRPDNCKTKICHVQIHWSRICLTTELVTQLPAKAEMSRKKTAAWTPHGQQLRKKNELSQNHCIVWAHSLTNIEKQGLIMGNFDYSDVPWNYFSVILHAVLRRFPSDCPKTSRDSQSRKH